MTNKRHRLSKDLKTSEVVKRENTHSDIKLSKHINTARARNRANALQRLKDMSNDGNLRKNPQAKPVFVAKLAPKSNRKGDRVTTLYNKIIASKKMFSKKSYDAAAVKALELKTGKAIPASFRFDVSEKGAFLVSIDEDYDRSTLRNLPESEQFEVLKGIFSKRQP